MLTKIPDKAEIKETLDDSNLHAAPGTDGIASYLYKECWDILDDSLTEVVQTVSAGQKLTKSQRTSLMVFGCKPKKPLSLKPDDKRKISLLNSDFKLTTGIQSKRFKKIATHTLSSRQLVAGDDRRIHHGINSARDAIIKAGISKQGCGIVDNDYKAAFDFLVMSWVFAVLQAKGLNQSVIDRIKNLYVDNITVVVVNNKMGRAFHNTRLSLRQGDLPSMFWFAYAIDPLLMYLEKRLIGIPIYKLPVLGPTLRGEPPLPALEERYKVISYADDVKPGITCMEEFRLVDQASLLFEKASGCVLHRNPTSGKCKVLLLGRWRGTVQQEDIPVNYVMISDHLDMVGVELKATSTQTRMANGDELVERVKNKVGPWLSGKFMPITQRPWSLNNYALSKVYYRCNSVDLRVKDLNAITSKIKSWLFKDQFEKPEDIITYRPASEGGLGLDNVKYKALSRLITSFLETSINPKFKHSLYHEAIYKYYVLEDRSIPDPGLPPYYTPSIFQVIKDLKMQGTLNISKMSSKDWYRHLIEEHVTMETNQEGRKSYIKCRVELQHHQNNWEMSWRLARLKGLESDQISFLWRLLHNLLPTQSRISRILNQPDSSCKVCQHPNDDLLHLFDCRSSSQVCQALLRSVRTRQPNISPQQIILLALELEPTMELPVVWLISSILLSVWNQKIVKKHSNMLEVRSTLEARVNMLRRGKKYKNEVIQINNLVENFS